MIVFLIIIIVGASAFIGWQVKNYYICREKFFKDQILFCEILIAETNFNKTPLKYVIEKNEKQFHKEFLKSLNNFEKSIASGNVFVEKTLILNSQEKESFNLFLNSLGKTNLENHNNLVNNYKEMVKSKLERQTEEEKKKGNAVFKISICIGLTLAILCI